SMCLLLFFSAASPALRLPHPFPTRRSSDLRYARHERVGEANFVRPVDDHDLPMPLDYFVWAIHRDGHPPVIVDTGFSESAGAARDRKSTRLNSSHVKISYAVFCLKKKKKNM